MPESLEDIFRDVDFIVKSLREADTWRQQGKIVSMTDCFEEAMIKSRSFDDDWLDKIGS